MRGIRRWWQDAGSVFVELAARGMFRCGRCGALHVKADVGRHYAWHRDVIRDA